MGVSRVGYHGRIQGGSSSEDPGWVFHGRIQGGSSSEDPGWAIIEDPGWHIIAGSRVCHYGRIQAG